MSDEGDSIEDGQTVWLVRSPTWRSEELNTLVYRIDQRLALLPQPLSQPRRPGPHSERTPTARVPTDLIHPQYQM